MSVRPLTECDDEQLANAGIVVVYDAGDLVYCYAATGTRIEDPSRQMVPVPASTAPRGSAAGSEAPVWETDQAAVEPGQMTGEPDEDTSSSPSRRQRRILVGATAAVAVSGASLLLPVNLLPDRLPGPPSVDRPTVPLSITQWEHRARAHLADITAQLQLVEAALRAWDAMPAHRREGLIPEQVTRLRERAVVLRRQHAALSANLAAVERLRAASAELGETQTQLGEVRALAWPFAPRSETATAWLREQEAMLTEKVSSQQATVQAFQIGVESATSAPLPASADVTRLAGEVISLVEQPTDPTPHRDMQPAPREPELLPAIALPVETRPDNDQPGEPGAVKDVHDTPVTAIPAPSLGTPAQPVRDATEIPTVVTVVTELAPAASPVPAPEVPVTAPTPPRAQPSQPIPEPASAPASFMNIHRAVDIGAACAHRKAPDLSGQDIAAHFAAANDCVAEVFNKARQQLRESLKTQIREDSSLRR